MSKLSKPVLVLCDDGWECKACPEIYLDDEAHSNQQIRITDDFGQVVAMSRDQFRVLVAKAKDGVLDTI